MKAEIKIPDGWFELGRGAARLSGDRYLDWYERKWKRDWLIEASGLRGFPVREVWIRKIKKQNGKT